MTRAKRSFLSAPRPTNRFDELLLGRNIAEGTVKLTDSLKSPIRSLPCAAFVYEAALVIGGLRATAIHRLKRVEVHAPFALVMDGGVLRVEPAASESFTQRDHLALTAENPGQNVAATEEPVTAGARVRARGSVREEPDGSLVMTMKRLEVLEKAPPGGGSGGAAPGGGGGGGGKKRRRR